MSAVAEPSLWLEDAAAAVPPRPEELPPLDENKVAVVIAAWNEAEQIGDTIRSLVTQTRPPDLIVVVSDNSTDDTCEVAWSAWETHVIRRDDEIWVLESVNNVHKKGGALNAGIFYLLEQERFPGFILTIDADTILDEYYIEYSVAAMCGLPEVGGLSSVCRGKKGLVKWPRWRDVAPLDRETLEKGNYRAHRVSARVKGRTVWFDARKPRPWPVRLMRRSRATRTGVLVAALKRAAMGKMLTWFQRAEYARYGKTRLRRNIHTLSGAGSMFRAQAIYDVLRDRRTLYLEEKTNRVEDFETTLEIKSHGWLCTNNAYCVAHTDLMTTVPALLAQRSRWVGGTMTELRRRGWRKETRLSILAVLTGLIEIPVMYAELGLMVYTMTEGAGGTIAVKSLWTLGVLSLFAGLGLRSMGWKSMIIGFLLVPEMAYGILLRHRWVFRGIRETLAQSSQW